MGEVHRTVRIALASSDRVAHSGDQQVMDRDVGHDPPGGPIRQQDVDAGECRAPIGDPQLHLLLAPRPQLARPVAGAVIEAPGAADIRRNRPAQHDADAVVVRREIILLRCIPLAPLHELAGALDAEPLHGIACPAAAVAFALEAILRREEPVAAVGRDMTLEVRFAAKQPKAVLHLPFDARTGEPRLATGGDEVSRDDE